MINAQPELQLKTRLSPLQVGTDNQWPHLIPPDTTTVQQTTEAIAISTERQASRRITPTGTVRVTSEGDTNIGIAELTMPAEIVAPAPPTEHRSSLTGEGRLKKARRQARKHQKMLAHKTYQCDEALAEKKRAKIKAKKLRRAIRQSTERNEAEEVNEATTHQSQQTHTKPQHTFQVVSDLAPNAVPTPIASACLGHRRRYRTFQRGAWKTPRKVLQKYKMPNDKHLDIPFESICGEHLDLSSDWTHNGTQAPTGKTISPSTTTELAYSDIPTDRQSELTYLDSSSDLNKNAAQVPMDKTIRTINTTELVYSDILTDRQPDPQMGSAYAEILTNAKIDPMQQDNSIERFWESYPDDAFDSFLGMTPEAKYEEQEKIGRTPAPINFRVTQMELSHPKQYTDTQAEFICPKILTDTQTGSDQRSSQGQQEDNVIQENLGGPTAGCNYTSQSSKKPPTDRAHIRGLEGHSARHPRDS